MKSKPAVLADRDWREQPVDETTCSFCEYFDGGGQRRVERAREAGADLGGDCLNRLSPRFETTSLQTCDHFFPSTSLEEEPTKDPAAGSLGAKAVVRQATADKLDPPPCTCTESLAAGAPHDPNCPRGVPLPRKNAAAVELGRLGGLKGGPARSKALSPERRSEIAAMGAAARLKKKKKKE